MDKVHIKMLRLRMGLSQEALAEKLGVSFATVNRWENGWTVPSPLSLSQLQALEKEQEYDPLKDYLFPYTMADAFDLAKQSLGRELTDEEAMIFAGEVKKMAGNNETLPQVLQIIVDEALPKKEKQ